MDRAGDASPQASCLQSGQLVDQVPDGTPPLVLLALTPLLTADVVYEWRGEFDNAEVNRLHAEGFERRRLDIEWRTHPSSRATVWEGNGSLLTAP